MKLLSTFLLLFCGTFTALAFSISNSTPIRDCDTLLTVEGKTYLCHILQQTKEETQFTLCNDPEEKVFVIPNRRVSKIALGQVDSFNETLAKDLETEANPEATPPPAQKLAKQKRKKTEGEMASAALWKGIISLVLTASIVLIPVGFFVGLSAVIKGRKLLKITKGNPAFKKIRRRARWAILLGGLSLLLSSWFIIWLIHALHNLPDIGNFDFSGAGWDWKNG